MSSFPCKIIEADLDADIVTLQMEGDYTVSAGQKYLCDAAAASAEPVAAPKGWRLVPVSPTKEMLLAGETDEYDTAIWWDLMLAAAPAAPVTVQPDLTQQTLDDVKAGIPARDAEIEALRKEIETLRAQLVDRSPEMQGKPVDESPILQGQQQPASNADGLPLILHDLNTSAGGRGFVAEYFESRVGRYDFTRYIRDRLAADFACALAAHLSQQDVLQAEVLDMVRMLEANEWADHCGQSELGQRLEWAITALQNRPQNIPEIIPESAQQDASKVDAALAEMVHAMFRSANSIPVTRITIDRKQYEAAIDAARKEAAHG